MSRLNQFSKGAELVGDVRFRGGNIGGNAFSASYCQHLMKSSIARTDTVAKNLFVLPPNAILDSLEIAGAAQSNAGTTATISVGKTGNNTFYLNALDVKGATGAGYPNLQGALAPANVFGSTPIGAVITVTGIYAETGTASTLGGPWDVILYYHLAP